MIQQESSLFAELEINDLARNGPFSTGMMTPDDEVNQFAIRSFRDQADADYICARMACRAALVGPFLWSSLQAVEKYLKCILLLNRIPAKNVRHDLAKAIQLINGSGKLTLDLTPLTSTFIDYLDEYGPYRYLEVSNFAFGKDIVRLDRAVWELRRHCSLSDLGGKVRLTQGVVAPEVRLTGGYLESVMDDRQNPARKVLLLHNGFFGKRRRKLVKVNGWMRGTNAPLYLHPRILDEVIKFVYLPREIIAGYRNHKGP